MSLSENRPMQGIFGVRNPRRQIIVRKNTGLHPWRWMCKTEDTPSWAYPNIIETVLQESVEGV